LTKAGRKRRSIATELHGKTRKSQKQKKEQAEALPRINREKHGIKMRRQKKDWTSAYAKVTKARGGKAEE